LKGHDEAIYETILPGKDYLYKMSGDGYNKTINIIKKARTTSVIFIIVFDIILFLRMNLKLFQ
jgi:hypothetical protein